MTTAGRVHRYVCLGAMAALLAVVETASAGSYALIVSGATGGPDYAQQYHRWRTDLVAALRAGEGFRDDHLIVLAETEAPGVGAATRSGVRAAFETLGARMDERSTLLVVLIGHGTDDGVDARFNLVGPDLTASDWTALVDAMPGRIVFVNTTAASHAFLPALAAPGRVVITATASAAQRYDTIFAEFLAAALTDPAADVDKDGQASAWETFAFASAAVRRWYQQAGRLATEQPRLDDVGDGRGIAADARPPGIGLASVVPLRAGIDLVVETDDPELARLLDRRASLEREVAELRAARRAASMPDEDYATELERRLLELARIAREIRRYEER